MLGAQLCQPFLSALEYLSPQPFFARLFPLAQLDNMTLSHSGRNANHAPRGPVLLKACQADTPFPPPLAL